MDSAIFNDLTRDDSLLQIVLQTVLDGMIIIDSCGTIQSFNQAAVEIFGYGAEEVIGQNVKILMPEPYHGGHDGYLHHFLTTGEKKVIGIGREVSGRRRDGSVFPMELGVNEMRIGENRLFVGTIRDISTRKAAETQILDKTKALVEVESLHRMLMEGVADYAIVHLDPEGRITTWNLGSQKLKGYTAEEIVGQNFSVFYTQADIDLGAPQQALDKARAEGKFEEECRRVRKDGSLFWAGIVIDPVRNERGDLTGFVKVTRDITQRKAAEDNLRAEAARLQAVMNTVLDGLVTIDSRGIVRSFNPSSVRIFGYQPDEVIGQNVKMLMPEPYHGGHDGYLSHYQTTGEKKVIGIGREVAARRKNGSVFPMELGVNEMWADGERMFVGTIRDISERKDAEAAIHTYVEKLKRSNQELDDFAYIASHDLKEPIRGLSNNAMFLQEDYGHSIEDGGRRRLNRMVYLCRRMEALVDDLLYFSRLGRQDLAIQRTDLNAMIRDIELMMDITLQEQNALIVVPKPLPVITCDVPRVTEVFRNLITNAVKYNDKPQKRIEIGVNDSQPQHPVFYVKDNGIGIEPRFYDDIFRIFKRLNEEDDTARGTGVGLTFVKKIVERHGGRIWLDSEPSNGTTFYFTLQASGGS